MRWAALWAVFGCAACGRVGFQREPTQDSGPHDAGPRMDAARADAGTTIDTGTPQLLDFGVTHERAWEVGLACGGKVKVFVEKLS